MSRRKLTFEDSPLPRFTDADIAAARRDLEYIADTISAEDLLGSLGLGEITLIDQPPSASGNTYSEDPSFNYTPLDQRPTETDWNYDGGDGSTVPLQPLKRPDQNQIPPDVLSYLLKSGKLNEVIHPNPPTTGGGQGFHGGQQQPDPHGTSNWGTPNTSNLSTNWGSPTNSPSNVSNNSQHMPLLPETNNSPSSQQQQQQDTFQNQSQTRHRFSPNAPEFVPRQYSPVEVFPHDVMRLAIAEVNRSNEQQHFNVQQHQNQNHFPPQQFQRFNSPQGPQYRGGGYNRQPRPNFQPRFQSQHPRQQQYRHSVQQQELSPEDRVLTSVTDTIAHLTINPADFNKEVKKTIKVMQESLVDADTLDIVVTLIVEQSVAKKNFSYTGAKLCQALNEKNIQVGTITAQNCVISRVQTVFVSSLNSIKNKTASNELQERHINLLFFLAELFVNFRIDTDGTGGGKSFFGFGLAIIEIMTQLIEYEKGVGAPNHENVKNVINVLKLSGWELEHHTNPKLKDDMDKLMKDLLYIQTVDERAKPQTKEIIGKIFELQKINWGRGDEADTSSASGSKSDSPPSSLVSYDGKSQQAVYEVDSSDDDEIYLDDESEEVNKFYEEFLNNLDNITRKN